MPASLAGTRRAWGTCARCGHARIRHLGPPLPGCAHVTVRLTVPGDRAQGVTHDRCECAGYSTTKD